MERFICFIYCAVVISFSNAQRTDVGRLNFKVNSLNRKTDFLQNEVTDLWAAVLTPGFVGRDLGNQSKADNPSTDDWRDCSIKVNEALTSVQELKSDIKGFMETSRDGLKNEKTWQREMGKNVSENLQDFQTEMTINNQDMKLQIDTLDRDFNNKLGILNNQFEERNRENAKELDAQIEINKQMRKELNTIRANQNTIVSENDALRQTIIGMQSELTKLQEKITTPSTTTTMTMTTTPPPTTTTMTTTTAAFLHSCDEGWRNFQGHCYIFVKGYKTFDEATAYCKQRNAYLTEIASDLELEFVIDLIGRYNHYVWIGAQYNASEGQFVYTYSKQSVPEKYWATGEPDNRREDENCAYWSYSRLYALKCSYRVYLVCEKS